MLNFAPDYKAITYFSDDELVKKMFVLYSGKYRVPHCPKSHTVLNLW
jgi:hypothetical protein